MNTALKNSVRPRINALVIKPQSNGTLDFKYVSPDRDNFLETLYRDLECNLVDVQFGGQWLSVWCDDEGLLKDRDSLMGLVVIDDNGDHHPLAGHIAITGVPDSDGNTTSIPNFTDTLSLDRIVTRIKPIRIRPHG